MRLVLIASMLMLSACDTEVTPPPGGDVILRAPGQFTATLNGEPYAAPSEFFETDSTFGIAAVLTDSTSFYFQSILFYSDSSGLGVREFAMYPSGAQVDNPTVSWADELDGDAVIHIYDLQPEEPAAFVVTELDRAANRLRATLTATYVRDAPGQSVLSRWPDTLRIEGEFVSELVPTDTLRR